MRASQLLLCFVVWGALVGVSCCSSAQEPKPAPVAIEMTAAEQVFSDLMTGASLVGSFTDGQLGDGAAPKSERYDLGIVRKVGDGLWLFSTRIRYGDHDITVPLTLPVEWAGDTAVIIVDKVGIPGLGEFSARVLIHDGRYAGYWHGAGHGGHLFGAVEPATEETDE